MTNEQREAIDKFKNLLKLKHTPFNGDRSVVVDKKDLDTVLSLIKEQQEEIEGLKNINKNQSKDIKKAVDYTFELNKQLKQKDEQIDLMAEHISKQDIDKDICMKNITNPDWCNEDYTNCQDCIKQYFADLVKKES